MNKTTNYQLPQWEANDPLRREDFNGAMADIDGGLDGLWDGLLQMGERYLKERYDAMDEEALTQEKNLLLNPLSSAEMADTLAEAEWDAERKVRIGRGPENLSREFLRDYCTGFTVGYTSTSYNASKNTALYEFTAPLNAVVQDFDLRYYMFFSTTASTFSGSLTFTAYQDIEGSYVPIYEKTGIPLELAGTTSIKSGFAVPVEVTLQKGAAYRFSLRMDSGQGVTSRFGFAVDTINGTQDLDDSAFTLAALPTTVGSHTRSIPLWDGATHGVVLLRWRQEEDQGGITAALDGIPLAQADRRETPGDGCTEYEAVFTGAGVFREEAALTLTLSCGETDDLRLIRYAALLL